MKKEVKEALKKELGMVRKSKIKLIVGVLMILLILFFVKIKILSGFCLLFLLPLPYHIRKEIEEYRARSLILRLRKQLVDEETLKKVKADQDNINE